MFLISGIIYILCVHGKYQYQFSFVEAPHEFIIAKFFIHKLMVALLAPTNIHACESKALQ